MVPATRYRNTAIARRSQQPGGGAPMLTALGVLALNATACVVIVL